MAKMSQTQESAPTQNVDLTSVLARLDALETENKALKAQVNPENEFKKAKEKYKGPWNYSYKMWGDVPVCSSKSIKKDKTKDFTYKNHLGQFMSNQNLELTLADGEVVTVDIHEFSLNFTRSEKVPCTPMKNGSVFIETMEDKADAYQFETEEFGKFTVVSGLIN